MVKLPDFKYVFFVVLALVFTIALSFATLETPVILNSIFVDYLHITDYNPAIQPELIEDFMNAYYIRQIGYTCLTVLFILIILGFTTKRTGLSTFGSVALFLPTFGYFAAYMFFLSGIGLLRVIWIPIWGLSIDLLKLGDIVYLPYMIFIYPLTLLFSLFIIDSGFPLFDLLRDSRMIHYFWDGFHLDLRYPLAYALIVLGLLIFTLGTIAWFYAKFKKMSTVDFWLYKYSRHPQYLGWIIWSYGIMLLASYTPVVRGGVNPGASFPWLISSIIVICVALMEEIKMKKKHRDSYTKYLESTPFMFPLPKLVSSAINFPIRILLNKNRPENGKEIIITFLVYILIFILLSLPFVLFNWPQYLGWSEWPFNTWPFIS